MSAAQASGFHPLRALALLVGAQSLFALLDAVGKALSHDMGIPLIALVRHAGQALLMVAVLGPRMGRTLFVTRHLDLTRYHRVFAPHHRWRQQVTAARRGRRKAETANEPAPARHLSMTWAQRLQRVSRSTS